MAAPRPSGTTPVSKTSRAFAVVFSILLCVSHGLVAHPIAAQGTRIERLFHNPKPEVEHAIQELHASLSGRLPILEGFVEVTDRPLLHYENGYYQCLAEVTSDTSGGTLVKVTAKITAWYSDPNPARSGYRVLPSNGRLESDLLERLEELLGKKTAGSATALPTATVSSPPRPRISEPPKLSASAVRPNTTNAAVINKPAVPPSVAGVGPPASVTPAPAVEPAALSPNEDLSSLRQQRLEAEKRMKELSDEIQSLEEILRSQAHPTNLAIVRKSATPVFGKPQTTAPVLLSADAEDEFEILAKEGSWVHVQIAGASRGWIRGTQLELPEALGGSSNKEPAAFAPPDEPPFRTTREETHAFNGDWEPLRGKTVKIIWVQPTAISRDPSPTRAKRDFAKSLFLKAYKETSLADSHVAGIVIVFDSADGGQIAATLASLAQWRAGTLSEASFWLQCSFDPAELFRDSGTSPESRPSR